MNQNATLAITSVSVAHFNAMLINSLKTDISSLCTSILAQPLLLYP